MATTYNSMPKFALGVDWETSGYSLPGYTTKHQGISFGAIIFDVKTLDTVEELYREIKFDSKYEWTDGAEKIHGITRAHLEQHGVPVEAAALELGNLIIKYCGTDDVILLGHRVHFDKAFTIQLMNTIGVELNYHPTSIDSCSMGTVLMEMTRLDEIIATLGMPARGKHNSLDDIRMTLASVKRMKELFLGGIMAELA